MSEQKTDRTSKRKLESLEKLTHKIFKSTETDLVMVARGIWGRGKTTRIKSAATEDRDFREFFGCPLSVAGAVWDLLQSFKKMPQDGMHRHLLWALMFMKVYGKEKTLCTLAGGIDKKTLRK